jgi:hypothetical protein
VHLRTLSIVPHPRSVILSSPSLTRCCQSPGCSRRKILAVAGSSADTRFTTRSMLASIVFPECNESLWRFPKVS